VIYLQTETRGKAERDRNKEKIIMHHDLVCDHGTVRPEPSLPTSLLGAISVGITRFRPEGNRAIMVDDNFRQYILILLPQDMLLEPGRAL
jgi:hypothetical protein